MMIQNMWLSRCSSSFLMLAPPSVQPGAATHTYEGICDLVRGFPYVLSKAGSSSDSVQPCSPVYS